MKEDTQKASLNVVIPQVIEIISALSCKKGLGKETEIIKEGYIDSLSVFNIILNLEKVFNIKINPMDATIEDFQTPVSIANMVVNLKGKM